MSPRVVVQEKSTEIMMSFVDREVVGEGEASTPAIPAREDVVEDEDWEPSKCYNRILKMSSLRFGRAELTKSFVNDLGRIDCEDFDDCFS